MACVDTMKLPQDGMMSARSHGGHGHGWEAACATNNCYGDTPRSLTASGRMMSAPQGLKVATPPVALRSLAEEGIPAGCVSSRTAGVKGGMGDHGIDAYAYRSPLHKSARSNLDPRGHGGLGPRSNPRASVMRGKSTGCLPASSGLIGQPAGSTPPWDAEGGLPVSPRSIASGYSSPAVSRAPLPRTPAEDGIPAGCVSSRIAGVRGGMGDYGIDAHAHNSPIHKSARSNLDPRDHTKLTPRSNPRASVSRGQRTAALGASSGLIGQVAGSTLPWEGSGAGETPRSLASSRAWSAPATPKVAAHSPRNLAAEGIPAGCVSGRTAGVKGGMGDYGIDGYTHNSPFHKSARNNLDPRDHGKLSRTNPRASVHRGMTQQRLGASSGLIGQPAGSTLPYEMKLDFTQTPRSLASARGESVPDRYSPNSGMLRTLHEDAVPAGCYSRRNVGGQMGDYGIDMAARSSGLHCSARNNMDPREHQRAHEGRPHNHRASITRQGKATRPLAASSGLIGQVAGSTLPWEAQVPQSARSLPSSRQPIEAWHDRRSSNASDHSAAPVAQLKEHLVGILSARKEAKA